MHKMCIIPQVKIVPKTLFPSLPVTFAEEFKFSRNLFGSKRIKLIINDQCLRFQSSANGLGSKCHIRKILF